MQKLDGESPTMASVNKSEDSFRFICFYFNGLSEQIKWQPVEDLSLLWMLLLEKVYGENFTNGGQSKWAIKKIIPGYLLVKRIVWN